MTTTITETNTAPVAPNSEKDNEMPDIQTLTSEVQQLQSSADWWASAALYLTALTAIIAALYFVASRIAINKSTQLRNAQAVLSAAKEEQMKSKVATDKQESDRKITGLQKDASDAKAAQQRVEIELAKQQERAAKAEKDLIEVQERIKHRNLTPDQQKELIAELKPFSDQEIDVFVLSDAGDEVGHISEQIVSVLKKSGWLVRIGNGSEVGIARSGIVISNLPDADAGSRKALSSLESALRSKGLEVNKPNSTTFTMEGRSWRVGTNTSTIAPIQMVIARK